MKTVGTIIGRFQVYELHAGHRHLIDWAIRESDELVILLGTSEVKTTVRNPLSFELRKEMILEIYPGAQVLEIKDNPSNEVWSKNVDSILEKNFPESKFRLFGSRDSFSESYSGKFSVTLVPELPEISGTQIRNGEIVPKCRESFRKGIIHAQKGRFPTSFQTVDIGLVNWEKREILLGRKRDDIPGQWRLPGGFVDPADESLESAASRELSEEVGNVLTHELKYVGSFRIDDHRYRGEQDKVLTALFLTYHLGGTPVASDDLAEIRWFPIDSDINLVIKTHQKIFQAIVEAATKY